MDATGGEGVEVVINITGAGTNTLEQGLATSRQSRHASSFRMPGKESLSEASFGRRELTLKSSNGHSYRSCERAIAMIASREVDVASLSTAPYGLNQAAEAIDAVAGLIDRSITFASIVPRISSAPERTSGLQAASSAELCVQPRVAICSWNSVRIWSPPLACQSFTI